MHSRTKIVFLVIDIQPLKPPLCKLASFLITTRDEAQEAIHWSELKNAGLDVLLLAADWLIYTQPVCLPDFTLFFINLLNKTGKPPAARCSAAPEVEPVT